MDHPDTKTVTRYGVRLYFPHRDIPYEYYVGTHDSVLITTLKPEDASTWSNPNDAYAALRAVKPSQLTKGCEMVTVFTVEEPTYDV